MGDGPIRRILGARLARRPRRPHAGRAALAVVILVAFGGLSGGAGLVGAGTEVPTCRGEPATIQGTTVADDFRASRGDDVIVLYGGDDRVRGGRGRDLICGASGDDRLVGSRGYDSLVGGPGFDRVHGARGDDAMRARRGDDVLIGDSPPFEAGAGGSDLFEAGEDPDGADEDQCNITGRGGDRVRRSCEFLSESIP